MLRLPINVHCFKQMISGNYWYIDKTRWIRRLFEDECMYKVIQLPGSGKSLFASMLNCFFNIEERDNDHLFQGLAISSNKKFTRAHQNKYPVIYIDFEQIIHEGDSPKAIFEKFKCCMINYAIKAQLSPEKIAEFKDRRIKDIFFDLLEIIKALGKQHQKKCILLIDHADKLLTHGYRYHCLEQMEALSAILLMLMKENVDLTAAYFFTNFLPIANEPLSNANSLNSNELTFEHRINHFFYFDGTEVNHTLDELNIELEDVNAYCASQDGINPELLMSYLAQKKHDLSILQQRDAKRMIYGDLTKLFETNHLCIDLPQPIRSSYFNTVGGNCLASCIVSWVRLGYLSLVSYENGRLQVQITNKYSHAIMNSLAQPMRQNNDKLKLMKLESSNETTFSNHAAQTFDQLKQSKCGDAERLEIGDYFYYLEEYEKAIYFYNLLLDANYALAAYNNRAAALFAIGANALPSLLAANCLNNDHPLILNNIGRYYLFCHRPLAWHYFNRTLIIDPLNEDAKSLLNQMNIDNTNRIESIKTLSFFKKQPPAGILHSDRITSPTMPGR